MDFVKFLTELGRMTGTTLLNFLTELYKMTKEILLKDLALRGKVEHYCTRPL